jgi:hypothetical protein
VVSEFLRNPQFQSGLLVTALALLFLALGSRPITESYPVESGICFAQKRSMALLRGLGLGLALGLFVWIVFKHQLAYPRRQIGNLIIGLLLVPWIKDIWGNLSKNQSRGEVLSKLKRLISVAVGVGIALAFFLMDFT